MTTYTTISNNDVDAESPLDTTLVTALRDNPTAITEGSSGAPKHQTASLEQTAGSEAVTKACMRDQSVGGVQMVHVTSASVVQAIGAGATWTPSVAGMYLVSGDAYLDSTTASNSGGVVMELFVAGSWRPVNTAGAGYEDFGTSGLIITDGGNVRFKNIAAGVSLNLYYLRYD